MVADSPDLDTNDRGDDDHDSDHDDGDRDGGDRDGGDRDGGDRDGGDGIEWPDGDTALDPSPDADIIANARRRYGSGGAMLAAGMLGLDNILREKFKPESVQVQEAPTDPIDLDAEGIRVTIDESMSVNAPALERVPLLDTKKKRRR